MKATTVGRLIAVTGVLLAAGLITLSMQESGNQGPPSPGRAANVVAARAGSSATGEREQPPAVLSTSMPGTGSGQSRSMLEWQRDLYDPRTTAVTFAAAIEAAETGNLTALREIRDLLVLCKLLIGTVREGRDREEYLSGYEATPNALRWRELHYDRCAAIATAPAFAQWPLTEGRLTPEYWEEVGTRFDDPLMRSFAIAEDVWAYDRAPIERRPELRARMVDNLQRVLRSADATAWWDLGFRLQDSRLSADKAVGIALIQVACARGYDCTKNNVHNLSLHCDVFDIPNCGSAATNMEALAQRESLATMARAHELHDRLTLLLDQGDWDEIQKLVPLDGTEFKE